jgi:hypothetical protein
LLLNHRLCSFEGSGQVRKEDWSEMTFDQMLRTQQAAQTKATAQGKAYLDQL